MRSSQYSEKLKDRRWLQKRLRILERDDFKCRDCGVNDSFDDIGLQVHHCYYKGEPWDVEDDFLLTLCENCHAVRQDFEDALRLSIGRLAARLKAADVDRFRVQFNRLTFEFERDLSKFIEKVYEGKPTL